MFIKSLTTAIGIVLMASAAAQAESTIWPECPENAVLAPAITATGPYLIEGFGTSSGQAAGLPNCEAVGQIVAILAKAVTDELIATVSTNADGTYTVTTAPSS